MLKSFRSPSIQLVFILLAITAMAVFSVLLKPAESNQLEAIPNRSAYNSKPSGLRAWYLAGQKVGLALSLWERPFEELSDLPTQATMLIIQPYAVGSRGVLYGPEAMTALRQWVARGNTLIVLDNFQRNASGSLLRPFGIQVEHHRPTGRIHNSQGRLIQISASKPLTLSPESEPLLGSFIQQPLYSQTMQSFAFPAKPAEPIEVLLQNAQQQPVLVRLPYQKGTFIFGTTPDLVDNQLLYQHRDANFQFLANLLTLEKKPVLINEFVHGYSQTQDIFSYFREKTPVGNIFMQLIFVFLLVLWLSFTRWTPVLATADTNKPKTNGLKQLIDSLASIYYRRQDATLAIQPQLTQINATLKRRYQVDLQDTPRLKSLIETLYAPYSSKDAVTVLQMLEKAQKMLGTETEEPSHLPHRELYQLSKELTDLQERLYAKR